jgi:uncharacterized protein YkwD
MRSSSYRLFAICLFSTVFILACSLPFVGANSPQNESAVLDSALPTQTPQDIVADQPETVEQATPEAADEEADDATQPSPTPTYTPTAAPPEPTPDGCEVTLNEEFIQVMLDLINQARMEAGVPPLITTPELMQSSQAHSRDMSCRNFFSHNNLEGETPFDRMEAAGYPLYYAAENIYAGQGVYNTPEKAVKAWLNSPGHRVNMLNPEYVHIGLGYAYTDTSYYGGYFTTDFGSTD